ncbi:MAG: glycoside hydrolase family 127 protein, partial [Bacteroidales bacterium]|nr:glycoside hydrolase family 127 protein [Bacteroidales bacterium]
MIKKGRFYQILWTTLLSWSLSFALYAQSPASGAGSNQTSFYPARFRLDEVTLLDSPFKRAQDLNFHFLMEYDVDRLLTPYVRQSGLSSTTDAKSPYYQWEFEHPAFNSFAWNPALAMDGHLLGHYLSALSLACSACHDEGTKAKLRERVDYIVRVLRDCQEVFDHNKDGLKGFIGGIPDNNIWKGLHDSNYRTYNERGHWTPFYCEHKVAAGLRDAYLYAGNAMAKTVFQKMCDWLIDIVSMFRDDVMEMQILQWEPGAINEVL